MSRRHCSRGSQGDSQIFPCEHPKGHCKPLHKLRLPVPPAQCQRRVHHHGLRGRGALQVTCGVTLEVFSAVCFPAPGACIELPAKRNLVSLFGSPSNIIIIFSTRGTARGHRALGLCRQCVAADVGLSPSAGYSWWKAPSLRNGRIDWVKKSR